MPLNMAALTETFKWHYYFILEFYFSLKKSSGLPDRLCHPKRHLIAWLKAQANIETAACHVLHGVSFGSGISYVHHCFLCHGNASVSSCFVYMPVPISQTCLFPCYCAVCIFKCVNEEAFLCCCLVNTLSERLTAFTVCLQMVFRYVCMSAFVCMSGAKERFPRAPDTSLTFSSSFHCSLSSLFQSK